MRERFWAKVDRSGECWTWTASTNASGYGQFSPTHGRTVVAHRIAWEEVNGPIPAGACVLHRCDTRLCVRPAHLFLGSRTDNAADMVTKGRSQKGEDHTQAKLTEREVSGIRGLYRLGLSQQRIADLHGVSRSAVQLIVTGRRWSHVTWPATLPALPDTSTEGTP